MPKKYRVMIEEINYRPFFKTFEADSEDAANQLAKDEADRLRMDQGLADVGWDEGDCSTEYELRPDVTTEEPAR
jgi:hypothetical protein